MRRDRGQIHERHVERVADRRRRGLVESIIKTERRCALSPRVLRSVLADTGSPQTDGPHGPVGQRIGPRPDLARAIEHARKTRCEE